MLVTFSAGANSIDELEIVELQQAVIHENVLNQPMDSQALMEE